ncbi:glutamate/aspartate:proton symporter GltP [Pseudoxanthomonas sangjuensis]|uniref:dicarboxylate/amino acid:cation symporter n=1 Tax=Pseudoxanthomonas sangjuensis TaxID=1503750 RepID=UPI001391DE50|nr:cation:dicarboxylase symporter family transporter [Pseudoxanthomonas sangjuensis]KAF1714296.1 dicarboxylate/amino acid:cation symporter [Pseudoxanthomonas sangjuensis]
MSTTARVLLALLLGAATGLGLYFWDQNTAGTVAGIVQPIGKLWINALQMTVVPLVTALVVLGVNSATDAAASGRIARNALVVFLVLLTLAATFAAFFAPAFLSLLPRDEADIANIKLALDPVAASSTTAAGLGEALASIIPSNAIAAAANSAMLPLVAFALFFGFALNRIDAERRARMLDLVQTIADTMIVIVRWVLWAAPVGVFALALVVCARVGAGVLGALAGYIAMLCAMYVAVTLLLYVVARVFGGEPFRRFAGAILPAQAVAVSTQSSLASLPAMIDSARVRLGYPLQVTSLVLPMAVSLFRITSPVQYIGVAFFVAWLYGIDIPPAHVVAGIAMAVVISMGSVGLPGQAIFMTTNLPVAQSMGLPLEPLGMLMVVDTLPDVFATLGNVSADLTAATVVAKRNAGDDAPA